MHEQNSVEFMGVLVDRHYTNGQKYAQLVFETTEGIRLSLSRNIRMVRSLRLGLTYKVKGPEHTVGQKRYIHEPTTTPVSVNASTPLFRRYKILVPVAVGVIVLLGGVGTLAASHGANTSGQPAVHKQTPAAKSVTETTTPSTAPTTSQPASDTEQASPSSSQQQAAAAYTPSTKKTTPSPIVTKTVTPNKTVTTPAVTDTPNVPALQEDTTGATMPTQTVEQASEDTTQTPTDTADSDTITAP